LSLVARSKVNRRRTPPRPRAYDDAGTADSAPGPWPWPWPWQSPHDRSARSAYL